MSVGCPEQFTVGGCGVAGCLIHQPNADDGPCEMAASAKRITQLAIEPGLSSNRTGRLTFPIAPALPGLGFSTIGANSEGTSGENLQTRYGACIINKNITFANISAKCIKSMFHDLQYFSGIAFMFCMLSEKSTSLDFPPL